MKKVSYIKTQWFRLLVSLASFTYALVIIFTSENAVMTDSLENMYIGIKDLTGCLSWTLTGVVWLVMSFIEYNSDRIEQLEKRIDILEQRAVTDIDKISDNNFMVRRRLGPDKDVPMPKET